MLRAGHWDGEAPEPGDFLRTAAGSCYLIEAVRPTRPGSQSRYVLGVRRLERDAVQPGQPGVHAWEFYSRQRAACRALDGQPA